MYTRSFPLDDLAIRSGGDGRTVEAYAAVFDTPSEIRDQDGHYSETISRAAFNKTIADRGLRFGVFYNHAMTLHGTPNERASVPLGSPLEVKADGTGVLTVTRYNKTPLADEVLEAIRNGDIRGQSFTGRMIRSTPEATRSRPFRAASDGSLTTVRRDEIALIEYGPTPFPAYEAASITGVRAVQLSDVDETLLRLILDGLTDVDMQIDWIADVIGRTDQAVDQALAVISHILNLPNPDANAADESRSTYLSRLSALATRLRDRAPAGANVTGASATAGETPKTLARHQVRARLRKAGLL